MKRVVTLSALACLLAATTAAAAPAASAGAADRPDRPAVGKHASLLDVVPARGKLRVCTTGDYPPFTHRDPETGEYSGVDISMAEDLAASLDAEPRYVATTWGEIIGDLANGRCDIAMGGVSVTLPRARKVSFSEPTREDGKTPITRCENVDKYQTLKQIDQPGTVVIVNPGGTNEEFARANIDQATIKVHDDNTTIFQEIIAGRADLMMTDASETEYQAGLNPELCAVHPDEPFTFAEKAYAVPRADVQFREYVDQFVHLATHDGTYDDYEDEWME